MYIILYNYIYVYSFKGYRESDKQRGGNKRTTTCPEILLYIEGSNVFLVLNLECQLNMPKIKHNESRHFHQIARHPFNTRISRELSSVGDITVSTYHINAPRILIELLKTQQHAWTLPPWDASRLDVGTHQLYIYSLNETILIHIYIYT